MDLRRGIIGVMNEAVTKNQRYFEWVFRLIDVAMRRESRPTARQSRDSWEKAVRDNAWYEYYEWHEL